MPKTSTRRKVKTNQAVGTRKTKLNAKGSHVETREEAAAPGGGLPYESDGDARRLA